MARRSLSLLIPTPRRDSSLLPFSSSPPPPPLPHRRHRLTDSSLARSGTRTRIEETKDEPPCFSSPNLPLLFHTFPLPPSAWLGNSSATPVRKTHPRHDAQSGYVLHTIDPTRWNLDATGCIAAPRRAGTTRHARCVRASVANLVESLVTFDHVLEPEEDVKDRPVRIEEFMTRRNGTCPNAYTRIS